MTKPDLFSKFPASFSASTERPSLRYIRKPGLFAVHGELPPSLASSTVFTLNEGAISVCRGDAVAKVATEVTVTPVYALEPDGPPAVPTGRVLVRFPPRIAVEKLQTDLAACGYAIAEQLSYAPNAAWVEARTDSIADSLAGISRLERLPDIANVEPQMLTRRALR